MSRDAHRPASYRTAFVALPYAVPFTAGLAFLLPGTVEFLDLVTAAHVTLPSLFEPLVVMTLGSVLVFFGVVGALAQAIRGAGGRHRPSDPA